MRGGRRQDSYVPQAEPINGLERWRRVSRERARPMKAPHGSGWRECPDRTMLARWSAPASIFRSTPSEGMLELLDRHAVRDETRADRVRIEQYHVRAFAVSQHVKPAHRQTANMALQIKSRAR